MHSSLQNIRPAQMQNLQHDKAFVNKQNQIQNDHRQVLQSTVNESEKSLQKLEETSKSEGQEIDDYLKQKKERERKKKKKKNSKKGLYTVKDEKGNDELHVDIKV